MHDDQKRRPGRPPKPETERKSRNFTFRSRGSLDAQLKEAARQSGRSVSEEIEFRLERSFAYDVASSQPWNLDLARDVVLLASLIETRTRKRWMTDSDTRQQLLEGCSELIIPTSWNYIEPKGRSLARIIRGEDHTYEELKHEQRFLDSMEELYRENDTDYYASGDDDGEPR